MRKNNLVSSLQIGGNMAVLLGLLFVGFQLYQDRALKRAELVFWQMDSNVQLHLALAGETPHEAIVRLAVAPETATVEDRYVASKVLDAILFQRRRFFLMQELGLFVEDDGQVFIDYEFGTDLGVNYLETQLSTFELDAKSIKAYSEATQDKSLNGRLLKYLEEDLGKDPSGED